MADPLQEPALATPPGVVSQFPTTHSNDQAWFYVGVVLAAFVPGCLLLLRLYTKVYIIRKVDVTDYLTTSSFLFLIALIICGRFGIAEGAGVHQWNLPNHNYFALLYWLYVIEIVYAPTIFLVKTAILLQYLRLFAPSKSVNPLLWYSVWTIISVTAVYYVISTSLSIWSCSPREAFWDLLITDARCIDNDATVLFTCLFNIVSDIIILMLPARAVWKLRIPTMNKIKIVCLFAMGLLACVANAMLIVYLNRIGGKNADVSYNIAWEFLCAIAEISFGLTVAGAFSLPKFIEAKGTTLRGIFSSFKRPLTSITSRNSSGIIMRSRMETTPPPGAMTDTATMIGNSERSSFQPDHDIERYPSYEGVHDPVKFPDVNITDAPHGF